MPEDTARREVFEEVGVRLQPPLMALGQWACPDPVADWHVFAADAPAGLPVSWRHAPTGGGEEHGLVFDVMWVDVSEAMDVFHPLFHPVLAMLRHHLDQVDNARANQS